MGGLEKPLSEVLAIANIFLSNRLLSFTMTTDQARPLHVEEAGYGGLKET